MPKRLIDYEAVWPSSKLLACKEWTRPEYLWLYGLADCNGSFEVTNMVAIHSVVSAIRPNFTLDTMKMVFREFYENGLLFVWHDGPKKYAHWVGSEIGSRLPALSHRLKFKKLAPAVPKPLLLNYIKAWEGRAQASYQLPLGKLGGSTGLGLGLGLGLGKDLLLIPPEVPVETALSGEFEIFWEQYPRKTGKKRAREKWKQTACAGHLGEILASIVSWQQTTQWQKDQGAFIPYPASWLHQELWKETPNKETTNGRASQSYSRPRNAVNSGREIDTSRHISLEA